MFIFKLSNSFFKKIAYSFIKLYQIFISPVTVPSCRFYPSCSDYALQAFNKKSFFTSLKLVALRISKCHPYSKGGYDPVE